ncbi:DUF3696 domain-containing protein, partial [Enterobacter cloacae complex sp.6730661]
ELGSLKDIHQQNADGTSLNIELEINSGTISWGFTDIDTQEKISNKHLTALTPIEITAELEYLTNNIQYLQAERYGPRVNYEIKKSDS